MRRIIFITILIFAFCSGVFTRENQPLIADSLAFDNFGKIPLNEQKARFDSFFVALRNDPEGKGFVVFRLDKKELKAKKRKRLIEIFQHFNFRRIDKSRVTFIVYEGTEEFTSLYVMPKKISLNDLLYILDIKDKDKDYKVIKGKDFEPKKIDELFPKK